MREEENSESGLPVSPYLERRWKEFLEQQREPLANLSVIYCREDMRLAFFAGVDAKADQITEKQLKNDLAGMEVVEAIDGMPPMLFGEARIYLPPFEVALTRMADAESSEDWSYKPEILESDPGVITLAVLYEKPILEVARAVADTRREWVKRYLAEAG